MSESMKRWLAVVRIVTGALFINNALPKLAAPYLLHFHQEVAAWAKDNPFPWFKAFLQQVILPHSQTAALSIGVAEFLVGVCLLAGFLSGLAALIGTVHGVAMMLATSHLTHAPAPGISHVLDANNVFAVLVLILLFAGRAGRTWGFGAKLGGSRSILW
ncbi:MAG: DoxX family membrane protein [Armatimonadetes bacterium]|nr:DoxX family membrane protein [Armatimonadota bacterium]